MATDDLRSLQGDGAIPMGEAQAPPPADDSSHSSTLGMETMAVHQAVEDVNDGREMGFMRSNNVLPAASSGLESPFSHRPGPSSGVSDNDVSDDTFVDASDRILDYQSSSPSSSASSSPRSDNDVSDDTFVDASDRILDYQSSSPSSSASSSPRSEYSRLDEINEDMEQLRETVPFKLRKYKEVFHKLLEERDLRIILAVADSSGQSVAQEPSSGSLNLHASTEIKKMSPKEAMTIVMKYGNNPKLFHQAVLCAGSGDVTTLDRRAFASFDDQRPCNGVEEIPRMCLQFVQHAEKGQSLVRFIHAAKDIVDNSGGKHHQLIIFTEHGWLRDPSVPEHSNQVKVEEVIRDASFRALSIVVVGVGDGPWDEMQRWIANHLPLPCDCCICLKVVIRNPVAFLCKHTMCMNCLERMYNILGEGVHRCPQCRRDLEGYTSEQSRRRFNNFHLVDLNKIMQTNDPREVKEAKLVLECFKETPNQCKAIRYLHLDRKPTGTEQHNRPLDPPPGCNAELLSWDEVEGLLPANPALWPRVLDLLEY